MTVTIRKWGNSLALRIPRSVAADSRLGSGSVVNVTLGEGKIIIEPVRRKKYKLNELLKGVTRKNIHPSDDSRALIGEPVIPALLVRSRLQQSRK